MSRIDIATIILAAGKGARMKSPLAKVLHKVGGRAMLGHVLDAAARLSPKRTAVVIGEHAPEVGEYARSENPAAEVFVQAPPRGTADAVAQAAPALDGFDGAVLVLYADTPLVAAASLQALAEEIENGAAVAVLGFKPEEAGAYGRLKENADGSLAAIVEARDASPEELAIRLCNSGVMAIEAAFLRDNLGRIGNDNAKGEFYLTDIVALATQDGRRAAVRHAPAGEVMGVNAQSELAAVEYEFQQRKRAAAMAAGASLIAPETVYFAHDTELGAHVVIEPNVIFGPGVTVGDHVVVKGFSHIEGAQIADGASVGPFARLRPGAEIGAGAKVGNFVEIKKAVLGDGAKASHLSYVGDARVGANANIGAGVITCNYDGYRKHETIIGENAFIGSNSALVAPVTVGDGAYVGSGSVITKDVDPDDLAVARGRQAAIKGWAARFRKTHDSGKD